MLHQMLGILTTYGYGALFIATVVEGPIVTVVASFLASKGLLDGALVYVIAVIGDLTGDLILYATGRWGWMIPRVRLSGRVDRRRIAQLRRQFRVHPGKVLLFGKLTHGAGFLFLLAAGAARIRLSTFVLYNFIGTLPKCAFFVALGYVAGAAYPRIDSYLGAASAAVCVLVIGAGLALAGQWRMPSQSGV
jgi:membrane protein DedA with SNARE-associated domain